MDYEHINHRRRVYLLGMLAQGTLGNTACGGGSSADPSIPQSTPLRLAPKLATPVRFPLRIEAGKRFIVDAGGRPFLLHGDTAWSIVGQLTNAEIDEYLADRSARGFTAVLFNAPEAYFTNQTPAYNNADGVAPFSPMTNFASPSDAYWSRVDHVVAQAKARRMACVINPAYLGYQNEGWLSAVAVASDASLRSYGAWLAKRYAQGNVIWCMGGDVDSPSSILAKQWNIVAGIRSIRTTDIITAHPWADASSADDASTYWNGYAGFNLNSVYGYETNGFYAYMLCAQASKRPIPFLGFEFKYENSNGASLAMLRRQSYGSLLSGACGQIYGNLPIWSFESTRWTYETYPGTWQSNLASTGAVHQSYVKALFSAYEWWNLEPKTDTSFVSSSLGSKAGRIYPARASDGSFAMIYVPNMRTVSIRMSELSPRKVRARFYSPARGTYEPIAGSPFANSGVVNIATEGECVIVLDAAR